MAEQQRGEYMNRLSFKAWPLLFLLVNSAAYAAVEQPEQLLGVSTNEGGITFQVQSNGCTFKRDFHFDVHENLEELSPHHGQAHQG
jgi:hypothetical protein